MAQTPVEKALASDAERAQALKEEAVVPSDDAFVGVDPVYRNYADDTGKPYFSGVDKIRAVEEAHAEREQELAFVAVPPVAEPLIEPPPLVAPAPVEDTPVEYNPTDPAPAPAAAKD